MNKKTQIEITGIIFMHIMGLLGIMAFTFLFLSSLDNVSSRAEALNEETLYYNFARRLVSSSDCFAYKAQNVFFDGKDIQSFSRENPGKIDMSKVFDYNHQNCLRYDLVSGSYEQVADAPDVSFPVVIYEITVTDLVDDTIYSFKNDVYRTEASGGVMNKVCDNRACLPDCLPDCNEIYKYQAEELTIINSETLACPNVEQYLDENILFGTTCWYEEMNKAARIVSPYTVGTKEKPICDVTCDNNCLPSCEEMSLLKEGELLWEDSETLKCHNENELINSEIIVGTTCWNNVKFDCDLPRIGVDVGQSGNVFQTSIEYSTVLSYPGFESQDFVEHPGIFHVKFCQIRIPTKCDPFFENYYYKDGVYIFDFNVLPTDEVYDPVWCNERGLPII